MHIRHSQHLNEQFLFSLSLPAYFDIIMFYTFEVGLARKSAASIGRNALKWFTTSIQAHDDILDSGARSHKIPSSRWVVGLYRRLGANRR